MTVLTPDTRHVDLGLFTAITAALAAAPPVGGVLRTVPTGTPYPFVRFMCVSEVDTYVLTGRAWGRFIYQIDTWDKNGSVIAAQDIGGTIATALMDAALTVSGGRVVFCRRGQRRETDPVENGIQYQRVSEDWEIEVVPT